MTRTPLLEELLEKLIFCEFSMEKRDHGSTWARLVSCYPAHNLMCSRCPTTTTKTGLCHASLRCRRRLKSFVKDVQDGFTRDAVASLALWSLILASGVNDVVDWPESNDRVQWQSPQLVQNSLLEVAPPFCFLGDTLYILGWQLWTRHNRRIACGIGQIQLAPAHPHNPQRKSLKLMCQKRHAPCKWNLGPNRIWPALPAMYWPDHDLLGVWWHHNGPTLSKSAHKTSSRRLTTWKRCYTPIDSYGMVIWNAGDQGLGSPPKNLVREIGRDCSL